MPSRQSTPAFPYGDFRLAIWLFASLLLTACSFTGQPAEPETVRILAPTGKLRVGLYAGTPTSLLVDAAPEARRGVGHDLGRALARELGVPFEPVVLANNAEVLAAVTAGRVDVIFTNATTERARDMDFSPICLEIELGYLVPKGSPLAALADIDRAGVRVGVTAKSSSEGRLKREFKQASVIGAATVKAGIGMLAAGEIDAYATNKPTLYEMGDQLPGSRVLEGRWGMEAMALGIPKGRDAGMPWLRRFVEKTKAEGLISAAIQRAGLRGAIEAKAP
ncbi:MAG: transporter substrate-binding domain-containing protein [Betaproteobacteria bacterium]|nr:transporter substrate-binding domain-containing protein [Betaproteobacteria bacterium]